MNIPYFNHTFILKSAVLLYCVTSCFRSFSNAISYYLLWSIVPARRAFIIFDYFVHISAKINFNLLRVSKISVISWICLRLICHCHVSLSNVIVTCHCHVSSSSVKSRLKSKLRLQKFASNLIHFDSLHRMYNKRWQIYSIIGLEAWFVMCLFLPMVCIFSQNVFL